MATTRTAADRVSCGDLYARWSEQLERHRPELHRGSPRVGGALLRLRAPSGDLEHALFFWGEDAVADNLSPYIDAAPREEQKYFLATQQVDEARHAVFSKRFMREVCGLGDGTAGEASGNRAGPDLGLPQGLRPPRPDGRRAPQGPAHPKLAAAITLYHFVIEASMAQSRSALHRALPDGTRHCRASVRACTTCRRTSSGTSRFTAIKRCCRTSWPRTPSARTPSQSCCGR